MNLPEIASEALIEIYHQLMRQMDGEGLSDFNISLIPWFWECGESRHLDQL
jgi:hypothetical protein